MRNIIGENPYNRLSGYRLESLRLVKDSDIKDKIILDIGCGNGWCEWNYLKRGVKKIYAIDTSKENLKIAKSINSKFILFKIGDAIDLPFNNNMFDTAVSWEVLEHIPANSEEKMFDEVQRVLKPGGYFFLSTPNKNVFSTTLDPAWWLTGHRNYSRKEIISYAENAGFEVEEIYTKGGIWSVFYALNMYIAKWLLRRGPLFNEFFYLKNKQEYSENNGFVNIFLKCKKNK